MMTTSHALRSGLAASALAALLFFAWRPLAAGNDAPAAGPASTPASVKAGEAVFFEYCAGCHGRRADGRGPESINLDPKPQNLRNAQFAKYLTDERIYSSLSGGVRGTAMPAFELVLTQEKRWHVLHYIRSLTAEDPISVPNSITRQSVPANAANPLAVNEQNAEAGKKNFLNYCASCHGQKADGKGIIAPNLAPAPRNLVAVTSWGEKPFIDYLTDARVYDSITNGVPGTSMQPWIGVLTDEQRWQTISYLRFEAEKERRAKSGETAGQ
jgi:mono/diheme cytochrome c family protein